jgi:hypothetical protein
VTQNKLGPGIHREEQILIAPVILFGEVPALLAADKTPDFVNLDGLGLDVADSLIEHLGAMLSSRRQHIQAGFLVKPCEPGYGPDADTLNKKVDDMRGLLLFNSHPVKGLCFRKCCPASGTTVTLDEPITVAEKSEPLGFALATTTIQLAFPGRSS